MARRIRPGDLTERVFPTHDPEGNPLPPPRGCAWWWYLVLLAVPGAALAAAGAALLASHLAEPHARSTRPQHFPQFIALTAVGGAIALIGSVCAVYQKCHADSVYAEWKAVEPAAALIFEAKGGYASVRPVPLHSARSGNGGLAGGARGGGGGARAPARGGGGGRGTAIAAGKTSATPTTAPRGRRKSRAVDGGGISGGAGVGSSSSVDCVHAAVTMGAPTSRAAAAPFSVDHCVLSEEDEEDDDVCVAIEMTSSHNGGEMASQSQPLLPAGSNGAAQSYGSTHHQQLSYGGTGPTTAAASAAGRRPGLPPLAPPSFGADSGAH